MRTLAAATSGYALAGCSDSDTPATNRDPQTLPRVATTGAVTSVEILPAQVLVVGQPRYVRFTVRDASQQLLAVPLNQVQVQILEGEGLLEFDAQGQAVGLAAGTVRATITVAGVSSSPQTVTIVTSPPARRRQETAETTVIQVPVSFPALSEEEPARSARLTLFGAGLQGVDLVAIVDRVIDGPHEVVAVLDDCLPGDWDFGVEYFIGAGGLGPISLLVYAVVTALARSISISTNDFCFIATELYGPQAPETCRLRAWRDAALRPRWWGRAVIRAYYCSAPYVVRLMRRSPRLRATISGLVARVVRRLERGQSSNEPTRVTSPVR